MIRYGYSQQKIDDLSSVNCNSNNWYLYKDLNFLVKFKKNNSNLIILFHGALPDVSDRECCFRGFNYEIEDTDILSVSDILVSKYTNFQISWFLSSNKYNNINDNYIEVFDYLINKQNYTKIIFTGTSGGGYPSLYFASYYKKIAVIGNSQIYPEHYWLYNDLINKLKENDDLLLYENKNIEKIIINQQPEKIYLYQNLNDKSLDHIGNAYYVPFVKFINDNNLNNILDLNLFRGLEPPEGKTDHHIFFPDKESHLSILKKIL
jgi:hypothetical protein